MINEQIKLITNELEKIKMDYVAISNELAKKEDEVAYLSNQLVGHVTSTEYNIGCELVMYGKLIKAIQRSDNMVTALKNIQKLYSDDLFDGREDLIDEIKNKVIKFMEHRKFDDTVETWCEDVKYEVTNDILFGYVLDTMENKI